MTMLAISTAESVLALIGLAIGVVVLVVVIGLFNRIMRPAGEIRSYAEDILEGGVGIARNLDGVDELRTTHALGSAVPGLAGAYLKKLGGGA